MHRSGAVGASSLRSERIIFDGLVAGRVISCHFRERSPRSRQASTLLPRCLEPRPQRRRRTLMETYFATLLPRCLEPHPQRRRRTLMWERNTSTLVVGGQPEGIDSLYQHLLTAER